MRRRGIALALSLVASAAAFGCDALLTEAPDSADLFDAPLDGLTREQLAAFVRGDEQFGRAFTPADGLGPIFNNRACAACHSGDGRGLPENVLVRFSRGLDPVPELGGPQIQDRALPGAQPEMLPAGVDVSRRLPPPVFGVGLIEAIPDSIILAGVDSLDADGDGISGRPSWVLAREFVPTTEPGGGPGLHLGRFSRKAQVSSLLQQVVEAYHQDMGVTTDFLPQENVNPLGGPGAETADGVPDPELPTASVMVVVDYLRMLAAPAPGADTPRRQRGRVLFDSVRCTACHVPALRTGASRIAALADRSVSLYSDLLLHDMGDGLADNRPDGAASGREFRTTPLWGLRLMRAFLNGQAFLLHDGRARTVEEAIFQHGGEAQRARDGFAALPAEDRAALLDFVESR